MLGTGENPALASLSLPDGLDDWLIEFVGEVRRETAILSENGAREAVSAREAVLRTFLRVAAARLEETVTIPEAAAVIGCVEETVRRKVREGLLSDTRANPRGHMRVKRGEFQRVAGKKTRKYDPIADAQDVAKLRRTAA